jgi:hypothetical protein
MLGELSNKGAIQMSNSLRRLAPLTGIPFAVLLAYTFFGTPNSPDAKDTGVQVIAHYQAHHSSHIAGDVCGGIAVVFFLFFISSLRSYFKAHEGGDGLSMAAFAGGIMIGVGGAIFTSLDFTLASDRNHLTPAAANAINVLSNDFFWPFSIGLIVFSFAIGLAIINTGALPKWLGWVMIVVGIVGFSPIGFFSFFVIMIWSVIVAILIYRRTGAAAAGTGGATPGVGAEPGLGT